MTKKYQAPKATGREYVDSAKEFQKFTTHMLLKLPEKWKDYILDPIYRSADNIETFVLRANRVYINHQYLSPEELKKAYGMRISLLRYAIREFDVFDTKFVHLTDHIELMQDEMKRMKFILKNMIVKELQQMEGSNPNIKYEIEIKHHLNQVEYTTTLGTRSVKLGMTPKNKDHWLDLEIAAKQEIEKRMSSDKQILLKL